MFDLSEFTDRVSLNTETEALESDEGEDSVIEFMCSERNHGVIPEPIPANKVLPEWYRELAPRSTGSGERKGLNTSTVKRCMPFLDALSMGWMLPLAAEVQFDAEDGQVNYGWSFDENMVSNHDLQQVGGDMFPNSEWPVMKFHNYWAIRVPDGYSLLVTNPLNRIEPRFQTFSGVVDADNYFNYINAPFMWTGGEYHGVIEAGTPIVQVIPFKRDGIISDGIVRAMDDDEHDQLEKEVRRIESAESMYRDERWQAKDGSRNLPE